MLRHGSVYGEKHLRRRRQRFGYVVFTFCHVGNPDDRVTPNFRAQHTVAPQTTFARFAISRFCWTHYLRTRLLHGYSRH